MATIKMITKKKVEGRKLYNLAVRGDESYIANGVVVHNCRSLLIPITKYEKFDPTKKIGNKPINEFIDENIGAGFSLK